jgi:hypothetical protein
MGENYIFKGNIIGVISDSKERLTAFKKTNTYDPGSDCVFRMYNSLGFEDAIINELINMGIKEIIIILKNEKEQTEEFFLTHPSDWKLISKSYFHKDYGLQRHIALESLRTMTRERCQ